MPLQLPVLDTRNFEQLLDEAKRRIPVYTPEWTNFGGESDPGITIVQLFAFLTESLLYRANRFPELNRFKFLQLLGIPLQPAAAADGIVAIRNERGPVQALPLDRGIVVSAGRVDFLTRDPVNVLPLEAQVYYKLRISPSDARYAGYQAKYEAILVATQAAAADEAATPATPTGAPAPATVQLDFYETTLLPSPTASAPNPEVDLAHDPIDRALYIALLAPKNVSPDDARAAIANQTLSIGIVPALTGDVPSLPAQRPTTQRTPSPDLIFERADVQGDVSIAQYARLRVLQQPDVLNAIGVVQVELPGASQLQTWSFPEPLEEGTGDFPPRIEDDKLSERLVTWVRIRLPAPQGAPAGTTNGSLTWIGINAARVTQAVPVVNELVGRPTGEPDQIFRLANTPVIDGSIGLIVEDVNGIPTQWRLTDDLLAAGTGEEVFTLDPESGQVTFGDGLRGANPAGRRILASYEYGGGPQGNVAIGAIKTSRDVRLQGGYKVENPVPSSGGARGQTVREGERSIPLVLRHRDRLVTAQDFHDVAQRTPGVDVGRVEVLPLFRPSDGTATAPGVVTVLVVPQFDALRPLWPTPDRLFLRRVCDYLDPRRLVTTEVYVRGPQYVGVYVSVGVQVSGGFFPDLVKQTVRDRLNGYLSVLPPGGPGGKGWPLNKRLMRKDLEAVVTRVPGVEFVDSLEMGVNTPQDIAEFDLSGLALPLLVALGVTEGAAEPLASLLATSPDPARIQVVPVPVSRSKC